MIFPVPGFACAVADGIANLLFPALPFGPSFANGFWTGMPDAGCT